MIIAGDRIDYYGQADKQKKDTKSDYLLTKLRFSRGKLKGKVSFLVTLPFIAFYFNYGLVTQTVIYFKSLDNNLQVVLVSGVL